MAPVLQGAVLMDTITQGHTFFSDQKKISQSRCVIYFFQSPENKKGCSLFFSPWTMLLWLSQKSEENREKIFVCASTERCEWLNAFLFREIFFLTKACPFSPSNRFPWRQRSKKFTEQSALAPYMFYEGRELTLLKTNTRWTIHAAVKLVWYVCAC